MLPLLRQLKLIQERLVNLNLPASQRRQLEALITQRLQNVDQTDILIASYDPEQQVDVLRSIANYQEFGRTFMRGKADKLAAIPDPLFEQAVSNQIKADGLDDEQ